MELKPELMECLNYYDCLENDNNQAMVIIYGYFKGEPLIAEVHYDGESENAILVRNKHQVLVLDKMHPQTRKNLLDYDEIIIHELYSYRSYMAKIVHNEEVAEIARKAVELHDYCFDLYPFPQMNGTFNTAEKTCQLCGKTKSLYFEGMTYNDSRDSGKKMTICPKCIKDGALFDKKHSRLFEFEDWPKYEGWSELFSNTPPFTLSNGKQTTHWAMHCNAWGEYLGRFEPEDMNERIKQNLIETWDNDFNKLYKEDPEEILEAFKNHEYNMHLFRCTDCLKLYCIFEDKE